MFTKRTWRYVCLVSRCEGTTEVGGRHAAQPHDADLLAAMAGTTVSRWFTSPTMGYR